MSDPRKAKTLEEAAMNADGTYDGARLISWISETLYPGNGVSEERVKQIWAEVLMRRSAGS